MLADVTRDLVPQRRRPDEETVSAVLGGRAHRDTEVGTDDVSLIVRSIPLRHQGEPIGALVLVRDVTDLRRRDRELVMTARGRVGQWLKLIAPVLTDRMAERAIEKGR